jgi:hypothetical protein
MVECRRNPAMSGIMANEGSKVVGNQIGLGIMPTDSRVILAAAMVLATVAAAEAQEKLQIIAKFGDWAITSSPNKNLSLSETTQQLAIVCGPSSRVYVIFVAVFDPAAVRTRPGYTAPSFQFTAWIDNEPPEDFEFSVGEGSLPMAAIFVPLSLDLDMPHTRIWKMLRAAKQRVSFSTPRKTVRVDATDLQSALKRLTDICLPLFSTLPVRESDIYR